MYNLFIAVLSTCTFILEMMGGIINYVSNCMFQSISTIDELAIME